MLDVFHGGVGQGDCGPQLVLADDAPTSGARAHPAHVTQCPTGAGTGPVSPDDAGQFCGATPSAYAGIVAEIRETHRRRQDFHRAEKSLTNQIKAIERRLLPAKMEVPPSPTLPAATDPHEEGDEVQGSIDPRCNHDDVAFFATLPLAEARAGIKKHRLAVERAFAKLAKQLPVYASFVEPVKGLGALGLAQIIGEAGDLSNYANPAKLWKRMGLAVINGKSQRKVAGAGALEQGYSPARRSVIFVIGDSLLKQQNPYRDVYLARKQREIEKAEAEGLQVAPAAKIPKARAAEYRSLGHIDKRARRYVEKRLLCDLWRAWCSAAVHMTPRSSLPSAVPSLASNT